MKSLTRIRSELNTDKYDHFLNLLHLEHVFEGYMDMTRDREEAENPHSPGGASASSWNVGACWATEDLGGA